MKRDFNFAEWLEVDKGNFQIPEDVVASVKELIYAAKEICDEHEIPFTCLLVTGADDERGYHVTTNSLLPMDRTPLELLVVNQIADGGLQNGLEFAEVAKGALKQEE